MTDKHVMRAAGIIHEYCVSRDALEVPCENCIMEHCCGKSPDQWDIYAIIAPRPSKLTTIAEPHSTMIGCQFCKWNANCPCQWHFNNAACLTMRTYISEPNS